jgi:hypothetical protein
MKTRQPDGAHKTQSRQERATSSIMNCAAFMMAVWAAIHRKRNRSGASPRLREVFTDNLRGQSLYVQLAQGPLPSALNRSDLTQQQVLASEASTCQSDAE